MDRHAGSVVPGACRWSRVPLGLALVLAWLGCATARVEGDEVSDGYPGEVVDEYPLDLGVDVDPDSGLPDTGSPIDVVDAPDLGPSCGSDGQPCCTGDGCYMGFVCTAGRCQAMVACGAMGQPCCTGSMCSAGLTCTAGTCRTTPCGATGQPCCMGTACNSGLTCTAGTCRAATCMLGEGTACAPGGTAPACCADSRTCGTIGSGHFCCRPAGGACTLDYGCCGTLVCSSGRCVAPVCGLDEAEPCTPGAGAPNCCADGRTCGSIGSGHFCCNNVGGDCTDDYGCCGSLFCDFGYCFYF